MALNQLSAIKVEKTSEPGRYADGQGLYLIVKSSGRKTWVFRYQMATRRRDMGLGVYHKKDNSLAMARTKVAEQRALIRKGIDPIDYRNQEKHKRRREQKEFISQIEAEKASQLLTFKFCAERYIQNKSGEWKNEKHKAQWKNTLETYVFPIIGDMPINDIELESIRAVLDPIWYTKTETASRIRQRMESVISSAIAMGERTKPNPAVWKGLLDNFYPQPDKLKRKRHIEAGTNQHHPAMPYEDIPIFMQELSSQNGVAAMALRFMILTASRTGEVRYAKWSEFNLKKKQWNIPGRRMKAGIDHRIALPDAAVKMLEDLPAISEYVFPGWKRGTALSSGAFRQVLRKMGIDRGKATPHGFRSSFRDYIGEETGFPHRLAEFALAHQLTDEAEKAYARGDMLKKRFTMMNAWANYVDSELIKTN